MAKGITRGKMAILVGGGPAPGINGVISAATIEGINQDEVATKILALQTNLQASYQTTSMLYQTTLTKYLPI